MTDLEPVIELPSASIEYVKRASLVLATVAVAVAMVGRRSGWLDYRPGGAAFDNFVSPIFVVLLIVAAVVALRFELVGATIAGFAAGALAAFAANQLVATHAAFVVALLAAPGVLWVVVAVSELSVRPAFAAIAAVAAMTITGFFVGTAIYDHFWGPSHPASSVAELRDSSLEWVWSGAVTSTSAEVRANPRGRYEQVRLAVSTDPQFDEPTWVNPIDPAGRVVGFAIDDLEPDTEYHYAVEVDGELDLVRAGRFATFPDGPASFTVAVGSCARVGSNGAVFDAIRELDPLLYLQVGDLHYGDTGVNDIERYRDVMDLTLSRPAQAALYRSTPIAYVWDDHDYGPNDADGNSPSRQAAMEAYREFVPSYPLGGPDSAVYQAFTIGRVRFILTDARSARDLDAGEDPGPRSMLGAEQRQWFEREVVDAAQTHELVVWVNPVPWVAEERDGADSWAGYADERRELADHIAANDIDNLLMVSGDAHMIAIDDGTNTDYTTTGAGGFPLLHAAALDRPGSVKGGPYSEGAVGGGGQFAMIDIADDGDAITVELTGLTWDGDEVMSYRFSTPGDTRDAG